MNYKLFAGIFALLALIFSMAPVSALCDEYYCYSPPIDPDVLIAIGNALGGIPDISVSVVKDIYYVDSGKTVDIKFEIENTGDYPATVIIQFEPDEDDEDYFTTNETSDKTIVEANTTKTMKFKIDVDKHTPSDGYYLPFKIMPYYTKFGGTYTLAEDTIDVEVHVDEYDDYLDVRLEDDVLCYNSELPYSTYLIFSNEGNDTYYIEPKVKSEELWPTVKSDIIEIPEDEEVKVKVNFNKTVSIGQYELTIKEDIYENKLYKNPKHFEKTLEVNVENCNSYYSNFYVSPSAQNVKANDKATFSFDFSNTTDNDLPVSFSGYADDQSVSVVFPSDTIIVEKNHNYTGQFYVMTSSYTKAGVKNITVRATTPYTSFEKKLIVNVLSDSLTVSADSIDVPVGLKGTQTITIKNSSTTQYVLALAVDPQNSDSFALSQNALTIDAGMTKTVYVNITPKTIGSKNYVFIVSGSVNKQTVINYTSNSEQDIASFVTGYQNKVNAVSGDWGTLPVLLDNPYDFATTLKVSLKPTNDVTSKPQNVTLGPKQKKSIDLQYLITSDAKTVKATLVIGSEVSSAEYPIYFTISQDASNTLALEITGLPEAIAFVNNSDSELTLKAKNPNAFEIKGASIKFLLNDSKVVGEAIFNISANAEKNVKVKYKIESDEDTTGSIVVKANGVENTYDVVYTKETGFFKTGLFNLGVGGTISIIIGAIIVVLIILYFALRKPSVPEVQE
ncbi:MAG: hypothetical protein COT14_01450 [Candidatus Diapherotrites archaeon CG08_land_8_20_14_0_20_30_16]|nr:MAG: hypothetical protein COT14_01450 [Candidatus Diapherotrites archaeon CG08_land_8_20_14_0_20_30_16]